MASLHEVPQYQCSIAPLVRTLGSGSLKRVQKKQGNIALYCTPRPQLGVMSRKLCSIRQLGKSMEAILKKRAQETHFFAKKKDEYLDPFYLPPAPPPVEAPFIPYTVPDNLKESQYALRCYDTHLYNGLLPIPSTLDPLLEEQLRLQDFCCFKALSRYNAAQLLYCCQRSPSTRKISRRLFIQPKPNVVGYEISVQSIPIARHLQESLEHIGFKLVERKHHVLKPDGWPTWVLLRGGANHQLPHLDLVDLRNPKVHILPRGYALKIVVNSELAKNK